MFYFLDLVFYMKLLLKVLLAVFGEETAAGTAA